MKRTNAAAVLLAAGLMAPWACEAGRLSTRDQLNVANRSAWADDTADVTKPRQLLYEAQEDGRYRVGYNLIRQADGDVKGYFARLTIKSLTDADAEVTADVTLLDAEGSVISPTDRDTFLELAKTLAGAKISPTKETARSSSGEESLTQAYLRGQAEGRTLKASADVDLGRKMTVWADSFWLKPVVTLPALSQVSGVRVFLAEPYHPLPLRLRVRVGESVFEFTTRAR